MELPHIIHLLPPEKRGFSKLLMLQENILPGKTPEQDKTLLLIVQNSKRTTWDV